METTMSIGRQSDVHKHLIAKRPLFSHSMAEDNAQTKITEPVQDEGLRVKEPPAKREEPTSTH
jgi:hypothetical protein